MDKICGIYKITSPVGKIYIGKSKNIKERWQCYARMSCKEQKLLYNSLKKYGFKQHLFEILLECKESELDTKEKYFIEHYNSLNRDFGLNIQYGEYQKIQNRQKLILKSELKRLKIEKDICRKQNRKLKDKIKRESRIMAFEEYMQTEEYIINLRNAWNPLDEGVEGDLPF